MISILFFFSSKTKKKIFTQTIACYYAPVVTFLKVARPFFIEQRAPKFPGDKGVKFVDRNQKNLKRLKPHINHILAKKGKSVTT